MSARDERRRRLAGIADCEHKAWMPSSPENLKDKRTLGERIVDALLAEGVACRAEVLREAAELGRELSRQGYSAQEIAKKLDRMADGGAA